MKPRAPQGQLRTRGPSAQQQRCVGELAATPKDPGPGRVCAEDGAGKRNGVRGSWWLKAQSRSGGRSRPPSPRSVWSATRGRRLPPLSSLVSKRPDPDVDTHPPAQTGPVLCTLRSSEDEDEPVTRKGAETERAPEGGSGVGPGALRAQALCAFFVRLFIHSFIRASIASV